MHNLLLQIEKLAYTLAKDSTLPYALPFQWLCVQGVSASVCVYVLLNVCVYVCVCVCVCL